MADTYYCHIHFHDEVWAAEWKMQGRNEWKSLSALLRNFTAVFRVKQKTVFLQWGNMDMGQCKRIYFSV